MQVYDSADVSSMVPDSASALLDDLRRRASLVRYDLACAGAGIVLVLLFLSIGWTAVAIGAGVAAALGFIVLAVWIAGQRTIRVDVDMDDEYAVAYRDLIRAFERLSSAGAVWNLESSQQTLDARRRSGAMLSISRRRVSPRRGLPPYYASNIIPPMMPAGRQNLFFLPDFLLVVEGNQFGAVEYPDLIVEVEPIVMIERDGVPRDAKTVGQTWEYVNKDGSPDRRYRHNPQWPVVEYVQVRLRSESGLHEVFLTSSAQVAHRFAEALKGMADVGAATDNQAATAPG
jgi:hypothetical protein